MKIFVITLTGSKERQANIQNQLDKFNLEYEFLFGVDGRKLTQTEIDNFYDSKKAKTFQRELNHTEIGCSMSHKLVYEKMINENIDCAIILEDGILLHPDFPYIVNNLNNIKINKIAIKLDRCNASQKINNNFKSGYFTPWHRVKLTENYCIGQPLGDPTLAGGYYIDLEAAGIIYSLIPKIFLVADAWWYFRKKIKFRVINSGLIWRDRALIPSIMYVRKNNKETFFLKFIKIIIKIIVYLIRLPIFLFK